jgi:spermidine synthase
MMARRKPTPRQLRPVSTHSANPAPVQRRPRLARADMLLLAALFTSGGAAVGLEFIWLRMLGLALGAESFGMLGVLAGFFAGLALGAAAFHLRIVRSARPISFYVAAEVAIALYALASPWFIPLLTEKIPRALWPWVGANQSFLALALDVAVAGAVFIPATLCMGITTVAAVEAMRRGRAAEAHARIVAWLYGANTVGAAAGVLVCTYWLMPQFGVRIASSLLALLSIAAAGGALLWQRARPVSDVPLATAKGRAPHDVSRAVPSARLGYLLLFCTGAAGIAIETLGTYVLAQVFDNTVHTFADILVVYLLGTAIGARLYASDGLQRWLDEPARATSTLLYALALASMLSAVVLRAAPALLAALSPADSYAGRMVAEALVAAAAFLPVTIVMGAVYSHVLGAYAARGVGVASAWNALGAALAPFVFALLIVPVFGYGVAFFAAVALYSLCFVSAALVARERHVPLRFALLIVAGVITFSPLVLVRFPSGAELLAQRTGLHGVVSVWQGAGGAEGLRRALQVDQKQVMGGLPGFVTKRMGHLAMLLADEPRRVAFLGVGTGITAGAALSHPVAHVTGVELVPEMLAMLQWFAPDNNGLERNSRVSLLASDARRYVRGVDERFDAVVADLYHPSRDGTASLYTVEHFTAIRERLTANGTFVQWLPLYQLRTDDLRTVMRTFLEVFPDAHAFIGNYSGNARLALVARRGDADLRVALPVVLRSVGDRSGAGEVFDGLRDVLASYMTDAAGMRAFAGNAPINTDTNQRLTFDAAAGALLGESRLAHESLRALLAYRKPFPDTLLKSDATESISSVRQRVAPYASAVTHYLQGEIERLDAPAGTSPAKATEFYLAAYRADPAFTLAIGKVIELGLADITQGDALVTRLLSITPAQPELVRLRDRLAVAPNVDQKRALLARFLETGGD